MAQREAACCPFLGYRVEILGEKIVWTIKNESSGEDRASAEVMLDRFYELPDPAEGASYGRFGRLG